MSDTRPTDPISVAFRMAGWMLLVLGAALGVVAPHPVTTAVWTAAGRAFARGGDAGMVLRLMSATKFGPRIRRRLNRPAPRRIGGVCEA
jgi:enoyl-CoA hydratase/carnithine racemase